MLRRSTVQTFPRNANWAGLNRTGTGGVPDDQQASESADRRGTRAVIAAGWEVSDYSAQVFAETFYHEFLNGETFGDAVLSGRKAAFDAEPHQNTWGAYQCYGDPQFRLFPATRTGRGSTGPALAVSQTISRLQNLQRAATKSESSTETRSQIEQIANNIPVSWLGNSALAASIGHAFGALKDFDTAIRYLDASAIQNDAGCTLKDMEQLANFKSRRAEELSSQQKDDKRTNSQIKDGRKSLNCGSP